MKIFDSGKWMQGESQRGNETYMKDLDVETLKDGIRYYTKLNRFMCMFAVITIFMSFGAGMMFMSDAVVETYSENAVIYKHGLSRMADEICELHGDDGVIYRISSGGSVQIQCERSSYGLRK